MAPILKLVNAEEQWSLYQQIWIFIWHSKSSTKTQFSQLLAMNNMTMEQNSGIPWF